MKDLGKTAYILGIKIYRDRSQRLSIEKNNKEDVSTRFQERILVNDTWYKSLQVLVSKDTRWVGKNAKDFVCFYFEFYHVCHAMHSTKRIMHDKFD